MVDLLIFYGAMLLVAVIWPLSMIQRGLPKFAPDGGFLEFDVLQAKYELAYRKRIVLTICCPLLLAYFLYRSFQPVDVLAARMVPGTGPMLIMFGTTFLVSVTAAVVLRYQSEKVIIARFPVFSDSLQPLSTRLFNLLGVGIPLALFAASYAYNSDEIVSLALVAGALIVLIVRIKLAPRLMKRGQIHVPMDSSLGQATSQTMSRFGFTPNELVFVPQMTTNAFAMPNGTVLVFTGLKNILTENELQAVIAHELSHARDGDGRKIQMRMFVCRFGALMLCALAGYLLAQTEAGRAYVLPVVVFAAASLLNVSSMIVGRFTRSLEFKCDRDAASFGFGPDLSSALIKLHRCMGQPIRYIGLDRVRLTHPSLEDRLVALKALTPP